VGLLGHKDGESLGQILTVYRLFPEDIDGIEGIKQQLSLRTPGPEFRLNTIDMEPIGFGLSVIIVSYVFSDRTDGLLDKLEEFLKSIPGVSEIEAISTTLV